jgi:hypothetical protein
MALLAIREIADHAKVTAYISISPTLMDENVYTASVTFCSDHDGEAPYINNGDLEKVGNAVLIHDSTECVVPLPA